MVGDKGYDTNAVVESIKKHEADVVIPSKSNRTTERIIDKNLYKDRNKVERFFLKIKQYRAVATRYDKKATCYLAVVQLACIMCWLK